MLLHPETSRPLRGVGTEGPIGFAATKEPMGRLSGSESRRGTCQSEVGGLATDDKGRRSLGEGAR